MDQVTGPVAEAVRGPSAQQAFELQTFGFTVLESVVPAAHAAALSEAAARADRAAGTDYTHQHAYARHVMNLPALDRAFLALVDHPLVLAVVEHVLGPDVILGSMNARIVRPGDPDQPLHSDIPAAFRKAGAPVMVNAVWMLDGFTPQNGGTRVVPGSHLFPDAEPPPGADVPYAVVPTGPPGSVLVFNGQCWHGGGANRAGRERRAVFAHYRVGHWMRFQCDPHEGFPAEWWPDLTDRQRALLRMQQGVGQPNAADYSRRR